MDCPATAPAVLIFVVVTAPAAMVGFGYVPVRSPPAADPPPTNPATGNGKLIFPTQVVGVGSNKVRELPAPSSSFTLAAPTVRVCEFTVPAAMSMVAASSIENKFVECFIGVKSFKSEISLLLSLMN